MTASYLDPRVRRTRALIEATLRDLLVERDLGQLSIADVATAAGVSRSTFYDHYDDLHQLAAAAFLSMFDELIGHAPVITSDTELTSNPLVALYAHVAQNARLYQALLGADGSAAVINHLIERIAIVIHVDRTRPGDRRTSHEDDPPQIPVDPYASFMAGALVGSVTHWLDHGCPGTPARFADQIWPLALAARGGDRSPPPA